VTLIVCQDKSAESGISIESSVSPGGSVKAEGLGDGPSHGTVAIAMLRLMLPPGRFPAWFLSCRKSEIVRMG